MKSGISDSTVHDVRWVTQADFMTSLCVELRSNMRNKHQITYSSPYIIIYTPVKLRISTSFSHLIHERHKSNGVLLRNKEVHQTFFHQYPVIIVSSPDNKLQFAGLLLCSLFWTHYIYAKHSSFCSVQVTYSEQVGYILYPSLPGSHIIPLSCKFPKAIFNWITTWHANVPCKSLHMT